jgi:hypothetical protein
MWIGPVKRREVIGFIVAVFIALVGSLILANQLAVPYCPCCGCQPPMPWYHQLACWLTGCF